MCPQNVQPALDAYKPIKWTAVDMSEDCLYLDVFTPDLRGKRDVLVWIHGGAFVLG